MLNLAIFLEQTARLQPAQDAVVFMETRLSWAQLNRAANQVAAGLQALGIGRGDKVALSCPNLPFFPIAYYGILKAGATVVPLNVLFKRREIAYHLEDSDAKAYLCFEGSPELPMAVEGFAGFSEVEACEHFIAITADPAGASPVEGALTLGQMMHGQSPVFDTVQTMPDDTAVILYTSGTTGVAKGAELTHFNMFQNAEEVSRVLSYSPDDVSLIVLPLFHSFGQTVLMNAGMAAGVTQVLMPRFSPEHVLGLMQKEKVTVFAGVPTMYWGLLSYPDAEKFDAVAIASRLRVNISGGAALPLEVLRGFEEKYGAPILEGYGLSETAPVACFNQLDIERKPGSIGIPLPRVEMRIVDDAGSDVPVGETGEVVIRGYNVMKGYYKRPEANAEALRGDWFHTGDVGRQDEDGYFYIVDRTKDMIIRGGFNVYPREVEETLMSHPSVSMVAVIGVPHDSHGEEIKAVVVLKPDAELSEDELVAWGKQELASYKYPRLVTFRDRLPMNATGKILKRELRADEDSSTSA